MCSELFRGLSNIRIARAARNFSRVNETIINHRTKRTLEEPSETYQIAEALAS